MKKLLISTTLAAVLVSGYGCSSKKDSNEAAKDINETKINDEATSKLQGESEGELKNESTHLVDLADTRLAKYELSKVAVDRATNPRVRAYARETVATHSADEKGIRDMAHKNQLTLATTLSQASQKLLSDLVDETAGNDFDGKYLSQMVTINDKAIDNAKAIRDKTENLETKNFMGKLIANDESHKAQATQLKGSL